jgi:hypothetical protein
LEFPQTRTSSRPVSKIAGAACVGPNQTFAASADSAKGATDKTALAAATQKHKALLALGWHITAHVEMPGSIPAEGTERSEA